MPVRLDRSIASHFVARGPARVLRWLASGLLPVLACFIQWTYWPLIKPMTWFLFYPAVFFSSWVGGMAAGLVATLEATVLCWYFFVPPEGMLVKHGFTALLTTAVFAGMGTLFSVFQGRLRNANRLCRLAARDLSQLFEQASEGIFVADLSGRCIDVNLAGSRLLALPREEIIGKAIADFASPEHREELEEARKLPLTTGGARSAEWGLRRSDGSCVPVEVNAKLLPDGRWQAFMHDISERRRAQEEIRRLTEIRERERLRLALESAASAMVMVDCGGRIVLTNSAADQLFGYAPDELKGQVIEVLVPERFRAIHPGLRAGFMKETVAKRAMGAGRDLWAQRKNGTELPVEIGLTRMKSEEGEFVVAAVIDITERKSAEQKLRDSEERFRLLVQSVKDYAIFMHDTEGMVTVWNEGAERILGYRADEVLGRHYSIFYACEDVASGRPGLDLKAAVERGSYQADEWRVRKDGGRFLANVIVTPVRGKGGTLLGYGKVIRDLTEIRKAEDALKRTVTELESFVYTVSHDLRSPLRAIQGYAHLARQRLEDRADPASLEMLRKISDSAVRLDLLIRDLLSYSGIARVGFVPAPVDLDKVIAHVVAQYPSLAKARLSIQRPLGVALAQESLMTQIVSNLLANAVKFVPSDRLPEVCVWTEKRGSGRLRLIVQDNGIGIPREHWGKIFDPFARLPAAKGLEGTGIGLAIVKKAVEQLGGRVDVESEPGKGSRFSIELAEA